MMSSLSIYYTIILWGCTLCTVLYFYVLYCIEYLMNYELNGMYGFFFIEIKGYNYNDCLVIV